MLIAILFTKMKTKRTPVPAFILLISFLLCIFSCSQPNSPRAIAEKFLYAFQQRDFNEAKKYSTKETVKLLQVLERISNEDSSETNAKNKIIITSEEISGEKAIVYFVEESSDAEQKLILKKVKVEGEKEKQWRVLLTKEDAKVGNKLKINPS